MRVNITIVIDLPITREEFLEGVTRFTDDLDDPTIYRASFVEHDQRDGTPAHFSLTISGDVKEP